MRPLALVLASGLAIGCHGGSGDDGVDSDTDAAVPAVAGLYEVTSDQASPDCGNLEDVALPLPFLSVVPVGDTIEIRTCRRTDDCDEFAESDQILTRSEKGWKTLVTWAYWNADADACLLNAKRTALRQPTDDTIALSGEGVVSQVSAPGRGTPDDAACETLLADWDPSFATDTQECWAREARRTTAE